MEARLRTLMGVLSLAYLFHPGLAEKSKLIVKVPHRIKHIHISHFKPVHVHTVESKQFHHHYHEDKHLGSDRLGGKDKEQRSFSNIKPIVWSPELQALKRPEGALAFTLGNKPKTHHKKRTEHFTESNRMPSKQSNSYKKEQWELSPHIFQSSDDGDSLRFEENVFRSNKNRGFSRGFRQSKGKHINSMGKHVRLEHDDSGWKPMMNFEDIIGGVNNFEMIHDGQFFNPETPGLHDYNEESIYRKKHAEITTPKKMEKQRIPQKNIGKGSWSNKFQKDDKKVNPFISQGGINHQKPLSNLQDDLHSLVHPSSIKYLKDSLLRDFEPKSPRASFFQQQPLQTQKPQHFMKSQLQQVNLQVQPKQPKQQERQKQKKLLQPDVHQQTQQKKNTQTKVYQQEWHQESVHHPTNTQQHFVHGHVLPAPVQEHIVNDKINKKTPNLSASSQKLLQVNSGLREVNPQKPQVKWHQSVQTGKNGAGSYNFEVVKYFPSTITTPGV